MRFRRWLSLGGETTPDPSTELDEELAFHAEMRAQQLQSAGLTRQAASDAAASEIRRIERYRERIIAEDLMRDTRVERARVFEEFRQDLRFGVRQLVRDRSFAVLAIVTLAIGIGVNTTVFTLIDRLFLRSLPFPEQSGLVSINLREGGYSYSPRLTERIAERTQRAFDLAAWTGWGFTMTGTGPAESLNGAAVTTNLFRVLGVAPQLGRTLREDDRLPGQRVAVISHGLWVRRFGSDPGIIGKALTLSGASIPVVGVMPPSFSFPDQAAEIWLPITWEDGQPPTEFSTKWVARLRPGVTRAAALSSVENAVLQMRQDNPDLPPEFGSSPSVTSLREALIGEFRKPAWILFGAVTFVLLIACVNVANLLMTRAQVRAREMAIRASLGARRGRLVRQLITESILLAGIGALLGLAIAHYGLRALLLWLPAEVTAFSDWSIDLRIVGYAIAAAILTVLLCGLTPALSVPLDRVFDRLKDASRSVSVGGAGKRTLRLLVTTETALSVLLAIGAGLMLQSFWRLRTESTGFDEDNVLTLSVTASSPAVPRPLRTAADSALATRSREMRRSFYRQLDERVSALPGVLSYGAIQITPMGGNNWNPTLAIEGRPVKATDEPEVDWRTVTTGFFRTMQIPLLRGRTFTAQDNADGEAVAVVNETLARRLFPGEDALGKRVSTGFEGEGNWVRIIGVTADMKDQTLSSDVHPMIFRPHEQVTINPMVLLIRTRGSPLRLVQAVEQTIHEIDADAATEGAQPLARVIGNSIARPRLLTILLTAFGVLATGLGSIGLFGVISYIVEQRKAEFAIRAALGAQRRDLLRLVFSDSLLTVLAGIVVGTLSAAALTSVLRSQLYEVEALDPLTFAAVGVIILLVAVLATLAPAWRAAQPAASQLSES